MSAALSPLNSLNGRQSASAPPVINRPQNSSSLDGGGLAGGHEEHLASGAQGATLQFAANGHARLAAAGEQGVGSERGPVSGSRCRHLAACACAASVHTSPASRQGSGQAGTRPTRTSRLHAVLCPPAQHIGERHAQRLLQQAVRGPEVVDRLQLSK